MIYQKKRKENHDKWLTVVGKTWDSKVKFTSSVCQDQSFIIKIKRVNNILQNVLMIVFQSFSYENKK